ncbi:hypothetical protein [Frankia nepalensis]|uniref:hypothetical protein n=2 Tax=Frankia nepalensis TaxID=1836974 RepID=UPI001EE48D5C|nr:hypothetical protein [Frankia nepalensis]
MGSRRLLITDFPAVYVYDTGGLGAATMSALLPATDPEATVGLVDQGTRLFVDARFPDGRAFQAATATPLPPELLTTLTGLHGRLLVDAGATSFVSPCAVSVTPRYENDPAGAATGAGQGAPPPGTTPPGMPAQGTPAQGTTAQGPVGGAEFPAYVVVKNGRLELRAGGRPLVDWPVNRVAVSPAGPTSAFVHGGAVLDGRFLTGVLLHLVTPDVLAAFLAVAQAGQQAAQPAAVGTSAPVWARGLATGADDDGAQAVRADCVLGDSVLELQARDDDARVLARFDLADPRLRVAGSAERFVIFDPEHGPVSVASDSEVFGRRLHAHPGVRAAAERTLATGGPYPAELAGGRPVACAVDAAALRVKGRGVRLRVPFAAIRAVEGTMAPAPESVAVDAATAEGVAAGGVAVPRASLRVATADTDLTVVGPLELIRALHTDVCAANYATEDPRRIPDMLRAAVGLEDDYFLYTIFGPFYELHAALRGDGTADGLGAPVTLPEDDEGRLRTAAALSEGLDELRRHLDQVGSVLPAFVRYRDAQVLAPAIGGRAEPDWLKAQESRLRAALAPAQRAAAETGALSAQVARLLDLDPSALPRPNYAGAALSLGAAFLNPVFLVSGASQAYNQYSQSEKRSAMMNAQSARGWAAVLDRWNTLVTSTLPVLGYVLTENLFDSRWETARRLTGALGATPPERRETAMRIVARRLARLDVLRRYPANAGIRLSRGEIAHYLRTARDSISTPRFVDF